MSSCIDPEALFSWCRIPAEQLEDHPDAKVQLKILPTPDDVHRWAAREMADEVKENNRQNRPTRWILPCGPTKQYPYFIEIVNSERISLRNVHVFHMDNCLDWEGRPIPLDHPFNYEGWMLRHFYAPIDPELSVPESQRHFPDVYDIDAVSRAIQAAGGIDTTYGGVGYRGHIAYNEAPRSPWYTVTAEAFRNSKTRILHLNDDTLIAVSQRNVGGCSHAVPPMAITLGMKDLLSARRIRLMSDTGAWKQAVVRVLLFGPTTVEYPVTFVQGHADALLVVDRATAAPPLGA
ncbi:MAG TPA: glucosamine-6-phosphate isomerase [Chloroflexota bacterium]|nr:glucosamine-6-phosphate isomerase [Chloroflexota bacterium]